MPIECLSVRERLSELAVSSLGDDDRREVERHLEWCAGCRKEARELREAAALAGLSLSQADPPPELGDRVVRRVRSAAVTGPTSARRIWIRRSMTVMAAVVGLVGLSLAGVLMARQQPLQDQLNNSEQQARSFERQFHQLLQAFPATQADRPHAVSRATLTALSGHRGGGGALRVVSPHFEDIALVIVGGMPQGGAPYKVWLTKVSGTRIFVGTIDKVDTAGGGKVANEFTSDLKLFRYVEVRDAKGRLVLRGAFTTSA